MSERTPTPASRSRTDKRETIRFNIQAGWRERLSDLTGVYPEKPVWANVNRHTFDGGLDLGWAQMDTSQDASYYGGWTSPTERAILTYVEGDVDYRSFPTEEEYTAALREWVDWAKDAGRFLGIDGMCRPGLIEHLDRLGFADARH